AHASSAPVLGVPVRLHTTSEHVAAAFEESFGRWRVLHEHHDLSWGSGLDAAFEVVSSVGADAGSGEVRHRHDGPVLHITGPGVIVRSDAAAALIEGQVSPKALSEGPRFRREVLEAAVLWAIAHGPHDRQPVHAAAVARGGTALLFTGRSGAGKSTLTYA